MSSLVITLLGLRRSLRCNGRSAVGCRLVRDGFFIILLLFLRRHHDDRPR
jgi:hypothetical protein